MTEVSVHGLPPASLRTKASPRRSSKTRHHAKPVNRQPQPAQPILSAKSGVYCLVLRPTGRAVEAEGLAYFDYDQNLVLVGASSLPAPSDFGCDRYVAWLKQPNGNWQRLALANCDAFWTGRHQSQTALTACDRLVITAEKSGRSAGPRLPQAVLAGDLADARTRTTDESSRFAGRRGLPLVRTLTAPAAEGVVYLNFFSNVAFVVTGNLPPPGTVYAGATAWTVWLHHENGDYTRACLTPGDNTHAARVELLGADLKTVSDIVISAEDGETAEPAGRRVLVGDLCNSCGPF